MFSKLVHHKNGPKMSVRFVYFNMMFLQGGGGGQLAISADCKGLFFRSSFVQERNVSDRKKASSSRSVSKLSFLLSKPFYLSKTQYTAVCHFLLLQESLMY